MGISKRKPPQVRNCAHCGAEFKPKHNMHFYCSVQHKRRANAARNRRKQHQLNSPERRLRRIIYTTPEPVEREGVPFGVEQILPGSFEHGKRR